MQVNKTKQLVIICLAALIGIGFLISPSQGQNISSYHSGEATEFRGSVYIGTTDTGNFELFSLEEVELCKKVDMVSPEGEDNPFNNLTFSKEDGSLYVYLVNDRYLYKYDLSEPRMPEFVSKTKDNSWYWYNGVEKRGDKVIVMGDKGVKVQRENGTVIKSYDVVNNIAKNISFSDKGNFIFNVTDKNIEIMDTFNQKVFSKIDYVNNSKELHVRQVYNREEESLMYFVDDISVKAVDFNGNVVNEFKHISDQGYDIIPSSDSDYVYFSDGVGVVKSRKSNLDPVDWKDTTRLGKAGGWAMGIEAVGQGEDEKLIVFNHSSILVLDDELELVAAVEAEENNYSPIEPMYLDVDKNRAVSGSKILLSGGGFGLYENLDIHFADKYFEVQADDDGRFDKMIEVPSVLPMKTDIKVIGQVTGKSYSIGFEIE